MLMVFQFFQDVLRTRPSAGIQFRPGDSMAIFDGEESVRIQLNQRRAGTLIRAIVFGPVLILCVAHATAQEITQQESDPPESVVAKSGEQYDEYHSSRLPDSYPMAETAGSGYDYTGEVSYSPPSYEPGYGAEYADPYSDASRRVPDYVKGGEYRKPTDICFVDVSTALVTTEATGQILAVDTEHQVVHEIFSDAKASFGRMVTLDENTIAVTERHAGRVFLFDLEHSEAGELTATKTLELDAPGLPWSIAWDASRSELFVSGAWSQRLYRWKLEPSAKKADDRWHVLERQTADLPMCGGQLLVLPRHECIMVVDAFGRDYVMLSIDSLESINQQEALRPQCDWTARLSG